MRIHDYNIDDLKNNIVIHAPLSRKQETYLNDKENDIIVWGGAASSGKSFLSALDILVNGWEDPHYRATIVRRQKEQFKQAGGLFDECSVMYSHYGVRPRGNSLDFKFHKGAFVKMMGSDRPQDKHDFQGNQSTTFLVDEAQQLNEENVVYLLSRNRSKSKQHHSLKLVCNPDYNSFLRRWLEMGGYLDEHGVPLPEMDGVTTYYCEVAGETVFLPSLEDYEKRYPHLEIGEDIVPQKFVFYAANVHDNPFVCKHQKPYVAKLKNLPMLERRRLYEGSWYAKEEQSGLFKREWCDIVMAGEVPPTARFARCWDRASTLPSTAYPDPDFTAGVKGCIDEQGNIWITDVVRFRERPAIVQKTIEEIGLQDGKYCLVGIPQDVGGAGKDSMEMSRASLMRCGLNVTVNRAYKSKATRFEPVSIMAQNRQIKIVKGDWNEAFFEELETLDFNIKHQKGRHDDQADALSDLIAVLKQKMYMPQVKINKSRSLTRRTRL